MNKEFLEKLLESNSMNSITKITGKSLTTIRYWCKKYNLSSKYCPIGVEQDGKISGGKIGEKSGKWGINKDKQTYEERVVSLPLKDINKDFQSGIKWRDVRKKYNLNFTFLTWLFNNNYLEKIPLEVIAKTRKNIIVSQETKNKLSKATKSFLKRNNLKCWWNKSPGNKSYVCEKVKEELKLKGIIFTEEFMPLLEKNRFFAIDIAIPEKKIGFEINGRQHYDYDGNLTPYFQNRHELIENEGWKLYEIKYDRKYFNIVDFIIKELNKLEG